MPSVVYHCTRTRIFAVVWTLTSFTDTLWKSNSSMRCLSRHWKGPSNHKLATGPRYTPLRIRISAALKDCTAFIGKYEPVPCPVWTCKSICTYWSSAKPCCDFIYYPIVKKCTRVLRISGKQHHPSCTMRRFLILEIKDAHSYTVSSRSFASFKNLSQTQAFYNPWVKKAQVFCSKLNPCNLKVRWSPCKRGYSIKWHAVCSWAQL